MARLVLERAGRGRAVLEGREVLYFGGCDYLGLAAHPRVVAALGVALERFGVSAGASRETSGDSSEHRALEAELAEFLGQEALLLLPEGWLANVALCESLAGERDLALIDERAHASLPGAARAAGIPAARYAHADAVALLRRLDERRPAAPCALTDGLFPALGRCAPVPELLRALPAGGLLVLDESHALGVLGARGRGTREELGVDDARVALTGTLSKALGCYGGFVAGGAALVEGVRARSGAYMGTTPVPPALAAAAREALALLREGELLAALRRNVELLHGALSGSDGPRTRLPVPVVALDTLSPAACLELHAALLDEGLLVPCVRYPGSPAGEGAWLRVAVSAAHSPDEIERLADALARHGAALGEVRP